MTESEKGRYNGSPVSWIIITVLLAGWTLFWWGSVWSYVLSITASAPPTISVSSWQIMVALVSPLLVVAAGGILWFTRSRWWPLVSTHLENHTVAIDALPDSHIGLWIALAAGLGLYLELVIIRLHSCYFQLFAYFKNVSLLSCFLGLGIGYARGHRRPLATPLVLPLLAVQILFMGILRYGQIGHALQNPIPEQFAFGLGQRFALCHIATVYGFLIMIFAFNALCFVPLGHLASRLMMRREKLLAYSWNLAGSLLGIVAISLISFAWAPPSVWVLLAVLGLIAFLYRNIPSLVPSVLASVLLLAFLGISFSVNQIEVYSPYQILDLNLEKKSYLELRINNVYSQRIFDTRKERIEETGLPADWYTHFALPYYFKREPGRVLIVGSGAGNDVAAAVGHGAGEIDAVEIDPAILEFGKLLHPQSPYQARNVNAIVNDARAYIRHTDKRYDLIVYGLLDSHALLSGMSGVRLDSFIYTVEAFREARARLKKGGILCLSFCLVRPELGRKLYLMLKEAFDGQPPVVYQTGYDVGYAFLDGEAEARDILRQPSVAGLQEVTAKFADSSIHADVSTDDWPFFYMPVKKYPVSYLTMIVLLLAVSLIYVRGLVRGSRGGFSVPCFFLGAGFMLVETKGITELALVYGSTWVVVSAVIAAILIMAFLANLLVIRIGNLRPLVTYPLLCGSLIAGLFLTSANVGGFALWMSCVIMTAVLTLPLFFSGFAFSVELRKSASVAVGLSSNLLGAMLGGFLEYNSMYFGFHSLYFIALAMYGIAFLGSLRSRC
jgi:spermidine synthase